MLQYVFNEHLRKDDPMIFVAEDQRWDEATLRELKEKYNIVFMTQKDGVMPIMILNKDSDNPIFVIGSEDDGRLHFKRKYGNFSNCFSFHWTKFLIADLEEALRICNKTIDVNNHE